MGYNLHLYNERLYNEWVAAVTTYAAAGRKFYILELCDGDFTLLHRLPYWYAGTWSQRLNEYPVLDFSYPFNDADVSPTDFAFPNTIALRDKDGELLERFVIAQRTDSRSRDGVQSVRVLAEGVLSQLGREYVTSYSTSTSTPVQDIVGDLFAFQINGVVKPISLGAFDAEIGDATRDFSVENVSILNALHELRRQVGGYFWVDTDHRLRWKKEMQSTIGQEIRLGKNLPALKVTTDYRTIRTRLHAKGWGLTDDDRLITTVNSDNQGTYGIVVGPYSNNAIREQDHLDKAAADRLEELKVPSKRLSAEAIDLSHCDGPLDYTHEGLVIGARVRLLDSELDQTLDCNIIGITRNLTHPMQVRIELADATIGASSPLYSGKQPDILEMLTDITERLKVLSEQDTGVLESIFGGAGATGDITTWDTDTNTGTFDDHLKDVMGTSVVPTFATDVQDVATTESAGDNEQISHGNHIHKGMPFISVATKNDLPTSTDGVIGYTEDTDRLYLRSASTWICISHLES